jgi:hypothetical protein
LKKQKKNGGGLVMADSTKVVVVKVGEDDYVFQKEGTGEKVGKKMSRGKIKALVLEKMLIPRAKKEAESLLVKADREFAVDQEIDLSFDADEKPASNEDILEFKADDQEEEDN